LFPSLTETYGNVTVEAMASGLAVVAFDCAAAKQWIKHGHNGLLASGFDTEDFIQAAVLAVQDKPLRHQCATNARRTALTVSWDQVIARFEDVLLSVVDHDHAASMAQTATA
jgi:glycosyltransferase involved in cell wall biosynthesis